MHKLVFYVPEDYLELTKEAVFGVGAGQIGHYEQCCWQVLGTGQFRPQKDSAPFVGEIGRLETVDEYRVELVCKDELIEAAVQVLLKAHPYEEPAYDVWRLADINV